jgi:hypothetical protein
MSTTEKTTRDPKVYEAIKGIRAMIKELAAIQRETRLKKKQKSLRKRVEITVLHRLYLKIRNKPYEDIHNIREGWEWTAEKFEKSLVARFEL